MNRYLLLSLFVAASCGPADVSTYVQPAIIQHCDGDDLDKLSMWVQKCVEDANPKSDEKPQDWVAQCEVTGFRVNCPSVPAVEYKFCRDCPWKRRACTDIAKSNMAPIIKSACGDSSVRDIPGPR